MAQERRQSGGQSGFGAEGEGPAAGGSWTVQVGVAQGRRINQLEVMLPAQPKALTHGSHTDHTGCHSLRLPGDRSWQCVGQSRGPWLRVAVADGRHDDSGRGQGFYRVYRIVEGEEYMSTSSDSGRAGGYGGWAPRRTSENVCGGSCDQDRDVGN